MTELTTNTARHAKRELDILVATVKDPIIGPFIPELLALAEKFGNNGDGGGSAPYTVGALSSAVHKLLLRKSLCPLMGIDEEWIDVTAYNDGVEWYQNNRESAIFKAGKDAQAYYLDAIVWVTQNGDKWSGGTAILPGGERLTTCQYIKSFPFTPESFFINVREVEESPNNFEYYIDDVNQLIPVFEYYDKYTEHLKPKTNATV